MAVDEGTVQRVREALQDESGVVEKRMFGGVGFLLGGNMACGAHGEKLIVRVGADAFDDAVARPHAAPFDMTGRPMKGWVWIDPPGFEDDDALADWVARGVSFARSLPPK